MTDTERNGSLLAVLEAEYPSGRITNEKVVKHPPPHATCDRRRNDCSMIRKEQEDKYVKYPLSNQAGQSNLVKDLPILMQLQNPSQIPLQSLHPPLPPITSRKTIEQTLTFSYPECYGPIFHLVVANLSSYSSSSSSHSLPTSFTPIPSLLAQLLTPPMRPPFWKNVPQFNASSLTPPITSTS